MKRIPLTDEPIKYFADYQREWSTFIEPRIGQICKFKVADSQLRMCGKQVRYLSRFFLRRAESLTHGIEIFQEDFGKEMVQDIAKERMETEFYTFAVVVNSLEKAFPNEAEKILNNFVEMLAFDALIGNNDRHPANWGIITSMKQRIPSRFSPIFDTARGLFWNMDEEGIQNRLENPKYLESYIEKSSPQIGWEGLSKLNHFSLLTLIYQNYPRFQGTLKKTALLVDLDECARILQAEFRELLSAQRISLIIKCLESRLRRVRDALT